MRRFESKLEPVPVNRFGGDFAAGLRRGSRAATLQPEP
jgi:hypothetical protein